MTVTSTEAKAGVRPIPKPEREPPEHETQYIFGALPAEIPTCFLAQFTGTPCAGRLERAHLICEQTIRKHVSRSKLVLWAPAVWRPACHAHHWMLDQAKTLRIPRSAIPAETEAWAAEHGLLWWLDRTYSA